MQVYYSSLAFNGYEPHSVVGLQRAHITTERMLKECVLLALLPMSYSLIDRLGLA